MALTPLQKRAERRGRNQSMVDMNLVSLIDVFTILIFFLLSNATGVEILPSPKEVMLPESIAQKDPREMLVIIVSAQDILVGGVRVASVRDVLAGNGDLIGPLKDELEARAAQQPPAVADASGVVHGRAVTIMGDKDIPYSLLRKVMVTASQASFSDVSFAVRQRDES
jgi:biopolymer transport protein ExbD